ncbi:hypothetical protein [Streptomyces sp. LN245]|uniref:hypothetical protein n=1 Tax=Streptomyces sp. LN245 TaxID=3112975 RepID=UPI00371DD854
MAAEVAVRCRAAAARYRKLAANGAYDDCLAAQDEVTMCRAPARHGRPAVPGRGRVMTAADPHDLTERLKQLNRWSSNRPK